MLKMETTHTSLAQSHVNFNWFDYIFSNNDIHIYIYIYILVYVCVCVCLIVFMIAFIQVINFSKY